MATFMTDPTGNTILRFETGFSSDIKSMLEGGWEKATQAQYDAYTASRAAIFDKARAKARAEALAAVDAQYALLAGAVEEATTVASSFGELPKVQPEEALKAQAKVTSSAVDFSPSAEGATSTQSTEGGIQLLDVFGSSEAKAKASARASKVAGA